MLFSPTKSSTAMNNGKQQDDEDDEDVEVMIPRDEDVLLGRGAHCWNHVGNRRFRRIVEKRLDEYVNATLRVEKARIVSEIMNELRQLGGRFLKRKDNHRHVLVKNEQIITEKIGHAIRDANKKNNKATAAKRQRTSSSSSMMSMPIKYDDGITEENVKMMSGATMGTNATDRQQHVKSTRCHSWPFSSTTTPTTAAAAAVAIATASLSQQQQQPSSSLSLRRKSLSAATTTNESPSLFLTSSFLQQRQQQQQPPSAFDFLIPPDNDSTTVSPSHLLSQTPPQRQHLSSSSSSSSSMWWHQQKLLQELRTATQTLNILHETQGKRAAFINMSQQHHHHHQQQQQQQQQFHQYDSSPYQATRQHDRTPQPSTTATSHHGWHQHSFSPPFPSSLLTRQSGTTMNHHEPARSIDEQLMNRMVVPTIASPSPWPITTRRDDDKERTIPIGGRARIFSTMRPSRHHTTTANIVAEDDANDRLSSQNTRESTRPDSEEQRDSNLMTLASLSSLMDRIPPTTGPD